MTKQQQQEVDRYQAIGAGIVITILVIICLVVGLHVSHNDQQINTYKNLTESVQLKNKSLLKDIIEPRYVVNAQGHLDDTSKNAINRLRSLFTKISTYASGSEYNANYKYAHQYIRDPKFYRTYLTPETDSSGNSAIDELDEKSQNNYTHVYEIEPGEYLVMVSFYMFHHSEDLDFNDKTPTNRALIMYGDDFRINHTDYLKNFNE